MLRSTHHSALPADRCVEGDLLQDSKSDISLQTFTYSLLPVQWDYCWLVTRHWLYLRTHMEL